MGEWKEYRVTDLATIHDDRRIPLSSMEREKRRGPYPYFGASGIVDHIDDYLFDGEFVLISEDGENLRSRQTPVAFKAKGKFWVNNHAHVVKGENDYLNDLLVYYIADLDLSPFITGAVQPKLSQESLLSIPIFLPQAESEQRAIASILSSLDDKIDLLDRQSKTLGALAETLFRQWFVQEVNGCEEVTLRDIADHAKESINPSRHPTLVFSHYSVPSYDEGREPKKELGKHILSNKFRVYSDSILISKLNPRFPRVWPVFGQIDETSSICSTEFQVVKPKDKNHFGFIYCYLKSPSVTQELESAVGGTSGSHQRVDPEVIFDLSFPKPPDEKIEEFGKLTNDYWLKINENDRQIRTLIQMRDALLPKLMSGEIRIRELKGDNLP